MSDNESSQEQALPRGDSFKLDLFYWLQALVFALVPLILVFTMLGRVSNVIGTSMLPTLNDGDLLLVQSLGYTPKQGDVIVLNKYTATFLGDEAIVKRVIATGGQAVAIDYAAQTVTVDGVALDEPYILEAMQDVGLYNSYMATYSLTVPEGSLFVMGDNRNGSTDSRDTRLGTIDQRYVLGRAWIVLFPFSDFGLLTRSV